jgi:hypothetical protein
MTQSRAAARASWPHPTRPRLGARTNYALHRLLVPTTLTRTLARLVEARPLLRRRFTAAERAVKERAFGCAMCGQCALPVTGYTCPQTCPKQLRNGPCGGVSPDGNCEVYPDTRCIWVIAYERCAAAGHLDYLTLLQRPVDHRLTGSSSWLNYWQGRDENLWSASSDVECEPRRWPIQEPVT